MKAPVQDMQASTPRSTARWSTADWIDTVVLVLLIVAMCSQVNVRAIGKNTLAQGFATKQLFVALSDVILLASFVWFVARTTILRAWGRLWWPPAPCWALLVAMLIATLHSQPIVNTVAESLAKAQGAGLKGLLKALITPESKEAIAEIVQFTAYFVFAPFLFVNLMHDRRNGELIERRRVALSAFTVAVFATACGAVWEMSRSSEPAPNALFGADNIYGGFLAMALPLLITRVMHEWRGKTAAAAMTLLALFMGVLTVVSLWAVIGLLIGIVVGGWLLLVPNRLALVLGATALLAYFVWTMPSQLKPNRTEFLRVRSKGEKVKKQYIEWYVALSWSNPRQTVTTLHVERLQAFATGVGPGNYQSNIGTYYQAQGLPMDEKEKMPPGSNNLYLVQTVSMGILGLGALLWMLGYFAKQAWTARYRFPLDWLGSGVLASLAAFCFINLFHALIVRGTGLVLAFILSLAIIAVQRAAQPDDAV